MKFSKRVLSVGLCLAVILSLAGCGGRAPSASDLFSQIGDPDPGKLHDLGIQVTMDAKAEDMNSGNEDGTAFSGDVSMDVSMGLAAMGTVAHIYDMNLTVGMSGFDMSVTGEAWADQTAGASYMRMSMLGQDSGWEKAGLSTGDEIISGSSIDMSGISGLTSSLSGFWSGNYEFSMRDRDKKGDYVVDWSIPLDKMIEMFGEADGLFDVPGAGDMHVDSDLKASAVFDYESQAIKSMSVSGKLNGAELAVNIEFRAWNADGSLAVPQDVVDSAVEQGSGLDDGFSLGGFSGSDDDNILDGDLTGSGEWAGMSADGPLWSDGAGSDQIIDNLGQQLYDTLDFDTYEYDSIRLWHLNEYSELDFTHQPDGDWTGSLEIRHYTDLTYGGAEGYLSSMKSVYDSLYSGMDPYFINETEVLYLEDNDSLVLCKVLPGRDMTVQADIYDYSSDGGVSDDVLLAHLAELLSLAGFQS